MIKNEKQLSTTKKHLAHFKTALEALKESKDDSDPLMRQLDIDSVQSKINDFQFDIMQYEKLKSGNLRSVSLDLENFNYGIIESRIAKGLTHKQFGRLLGVSEQQIQKYESENYLSISVRRAQELLSALEVTATTKFQFNIDKGNSKKFLTPKDIDSENIALTFRNRGTTVNVCAD